ncbi:MAG: histidine kinase [Desulfatitalea sp. BRH_c12]|nr:MAG: histidine kinase [Desulfatitalea sp. BRH_c12]
MSIITVYSGSFCNEEAVVRALVARTGYQLVSDADLVAEAAKLSGIPEPKIDRVFSARPSVFNKFTHERERSLAHLRLAAARAVVANNLVISGYGGQLVSRTINHVLRVCLIADRKARTAQAAAAMQVTDQDAAKLIQKQDEDRAEWVRALFDHTDPWAPQLYDMVLPTDKMDPATIAAAIADSAASAVVRPTDRSQRAAADFLLAALVEVALVQEGHQAGVHVKDGEVTLTINKHVLMLTRLESELKTIAAKVPGVKAVQTKVGPGFYQADIYRKQDFNMPSKILLVDDEREFVQTLSERLLMRDMGSAVAYDGESALEVVREDEPDVMILDLKMPGIDGIEVLRRVKTTQPEIEVIILTGHGSEADRLVCMQLGAFAYLQKPVDVEELSATIKSANEKIRQKNALRQ